MPRIFYTGTVLPLELGLDHQNTAKIRWKIEPGSGVEVEFSISIRASLITVTCDYDGLLTADDVVLAYVRASDLARTTVGLFSLATGYGLTPVLDTLVDAAGNKKSMVPHDGRLIAICTAFGIEPARSADFAVVYRIVLEEPALFLALHDYTNAMAYPHAVPVSCARVVETVRHQIAPGSPRDDQWAAMRTALRLERSYIKVVMDAALDGRHGDRSFAPPETTKEVMLRTATIFNRLLEYRKRGNAALPESDFPMLS
jgi:hypothetical protein